MTDSVVATPDPAASSAPPAPWHQGFKDPLVAAHAATKNWADPEEAVRSNLNLEKLIGVPQDQILKLPKADAEAKEWDAVYTRLGYPKTAEEYKLEVPVGADDAYAKHLAGIMHEQKLTVKQAQAVAKGQAEFVQAAIAKETAEAARISTVEQEELDKEWGATKDKKLAVARAAATTFGLTKEVIDDLQDAMGLKKTMLFLYNLGSRLGEDAFEGSGGNFSGVKSPTEAQNEIAALRADQKFVAKLLSNDVEAKSRMHKLHLQAYPG